MIADILNPLEEYKNVFYPRFKDVCEQTFAKMAKDANVDVTKNRETCKKLYSSEELFSSIKKRIGWCVFFCCILWIAVAAGIIVLIAEWDDLEFGILIAIGVSLIVILVCLFAKVHPHIKKLKKEREDTQTTIDTLRTEAWGQMDPLNRLYDWDIFTRMTTKAIPRLEFDPYFTTQRLADLKKVYGWNDSFNRDRSVIYSHSGLINGNPFVICRTRKMEWGNKTYVGSKTIHWTTYEKDINGKGQTIHHTETLYAEYTAPYPEYYEKTRLIYGNTAAPDLIFNRESNGLAGKENTLRYKRNKRQLKKKADDLNNSDFAMLTNEEFEVAFDTRDRNNNQQFALLFTPLAQENILALLTDNTIGYGDDFDFHKNQMINVIISRHMQDQNLDMNPDQFRHFDYEKAAEIFQIVNANYFRAVYFTLAPIISVPMYQQIRSQQDIYGRDMKQESAFWEHEALANFWGQDKFKHSDCVTDCIIKTNQKRELDGASTIQVYAYGYKAQKHVIYIDKWGGDGRLHKVPVEWYEYLPVVGEGNIQIKEDNDTQTTYSSQTEQLKHIKDVLDRSHMNFYRRHIASRVE